RFSDFVDTYTRDLKAEDLQRLFTRDTREAYWFFARHIDLKALEKLPWHRRFIAHLRLFLHEFTLRLSPARRIVYAVSLAVAAFALFSLLRFGFAERHVGRVTVLLPGIVLPDGTTSLLIAFALMNLLVLLEVADRLSLKNDLEIARQIQQAMLPPGV